MSFDLFSQPPTLEDARASRDIILKRVEENAGEVFNRKAREFALEYLKQHGPKTGEDITDSAKAAGIFPPHHDKQFGPVYMHLSRAGLITKEGTANRRKGHGSSGATLWRVVIMQRA